MQSWISTRKAPRIVGEWYSTSAASRRSPALANRRLQLAWHRQPSADAQTPRKLVEADAAGK